MSFPNTPPNLVTATAAMLRAIFPPARRRLPRAAAALLRALQRHHPETYRHSLRVRRYALLLAQALDLDAAQRRQLHRAALLHDVGKLAVGLDVLNKPTRLTADELREMRRHPALGEQLLAAVIRDPAVHAIVRHHHERHDGTGYPDGLAGEAIPLGARVLALADCFDAIRGPRAYHAGLPASEALALIRWNAGGQFDPQLAHRFVEVVCTFEGCNVWG